MDSLEMSSGSDSEWFEDESASESDASDTFQDVEDQGTLPAEEEGLVSLLNEAGPVSAAVLRLEAVVCCAKMCIVGKRAEVQQLLAALQEMTKSEKQTSILTALGVCAVVGQKDVKQRQRFHYYVPFVGFVCKYAFQSVYGISHKTLQIYRQRVRDGTVAAKRHGNTENKNASALDEDALASWFESFACAVGDVVPVRVRLKKTGPNTKRRYFSYENYTLIPPAFTWERLRQEYLVHLDEQYADTPRPSESSFARILSKRCPNISIRSGRDQVCDVCSIYRMSLGRETNAGDAEVFGDHLVDARAMRCDSDTFV
jgi:hypothetical protein